MAVVGIGVDVVDVVRFEESIARTPGLIDRLFTVAERDLPPAGLAARFAAKEAVTKALGGAGGRSWQDVEIRSDAEGAPTVWVRDSDWTWHVSLSHDAGLAIAMVVAEG